ncbi:hypothetical protein OYC64_011284 [Pagothenia borchgrevinki]|uniref:Endonuclease/exonuclease/phosphatase domain-containing protein n=2 Tax=Pagothenia borchgrevinki TaxID=8213 RepID=A0ABD2GZP8_PAGBO
MKIAAFNVKRLGWTKVNKKAVREIIIEILSEYSVVVLLEVMDESGKAMKLLLKHLNNYGDNRSNPYGMLCSERLGRTTYKEKFVYFYRKKEVKIEDSYQYVENDEDNEDDEDEEDVDELAREPFAVLLKCPSTVVQNLVLIPVHTKPSDAEAELNALHEVVEDVRERWQNDNIIILGDFNADGPSLSMRKKDSILISSAPYYWLIDDDVDTTTSNNNDHTYDRIVVYGERMLKAIVPDSAIAYNFEEELNLTEEETQSVSDHYPVEVELKQKALRKRNPGTTGVKMKIAAFNVKRLGWTKVNKKAVREIIIEIVSEYSVVVLLEVMDESGKAMKLLLKHLNNYGDNRSNPYGMLCSERLGRTTYKEKFVYFYRKKEVKIEDSYQYVENDEDNEDDEDEEDVDELAREPFAVLLKCPSTVVQDLVLIPVHTKPSDAEAELNALHEVVEDVRERWQNDNIIILGDFNADGPSLSMRKKDSILISSAPYYWLIDDDVDTTTSNNNDHTYDRIVVYGERMLKAIVPNSAIAYNFEEELNLTEEETQSVSDHYPVEVELKQKALRKRNPGTTGAAQKKKPGPAAKKRRGA